MSSKSVIVVLKSILDTDLQEWQVSLGGKYFFFWKAVKFFIIGDKSL